ncbi:hypothetical protein BV20DRAFT_954008 [Pilatotrama ljubarskyi]|nr:hypothetical protein BV20DRAFT_954008 [Pilatotrama ljubarskyi]
MVEAALDNLVKTGVLQKSNHMDVASLLALDIEAHVIEETSDEDIFLTVRRRAEEERETPESAHANIDSQEEVEPLPTRREALQAAATLTRYTNALDDPLARKLEEILRQFGQQLSLDIQRSMRETSITDYLLRQ